MGEMSFAWVLDDVVLLFLMQEKNLESQTSSILETVEINL